MYKLIFSLVIVFLLVVPSNVFSEEKEEVNYNDNSEDHSIQYSVELGDGRGSILVFGDNNTIHVPDTQNGLGVEPNTITHQGDRFTMVLTETEIIVDGVIQKFDTLVFTLIGNKWELVWWEQ